MDFMRSNGDVVTQIFLTDNGSVRPDAALWLRCLAEAVGERAGLAVEPVSLLHSSGIEASELGGRPAEILEPAIRRRARAGERDFLVVPLFFGPSRAITEYIPLRVKALKQDYPDLRVRVAPCLVDVEDAADDRLARVLADALRRFFEVRGLGKPALALIDHGTPHRAVNAVREHVGAQLRALLAGQCAAFATCSMERREGAEYDFNEPLLENLLGMEGFRRGDVALCPLFFLPGRHAGPGGDIAGICAAAEARFPGLRVHAGPLVGELPALQGLLAEKLQAGLASEPL